jgi:hypothetical protein
MLITHDPSPLELIAQQMAFIGSSVRSTFSNSAATHDETCTRCHDADEADNCPACEA